MKRLSAKARLTTLVIFFFLLFVPHAVWAATLITILAADTNDSKIGESVRSDIRNVDAYLRQIARDADLTYKSVVLHGYDFTKAKLISAVDSVRPGPDDVCFVYVSSHGFGTRGSKWPYVSLGNSESLQLSWIFQSLKEKTPRLLFVGADCCNVLLDRIYRNAQPKPPARRASQGYKLLFRSFRGAVLVSSSITGQYSLGPESGGLFTNQFLTSLNAVAASSSPTWHTLMENATKPIYIGHNEQQFQTPQYQIYGMHNVGGTGSTEPETPPPVTGGGPIVGDGNGGNDGTNVPAPADYFYVHVSGMNCRLYLLSTNEKIASGSYRISGMNQAYRLFVGPLQTVSLKVSGMGNVILVDPSLRGRVGYSASGMNNAAGFFNNSSPPQSVSSPFGRQNRTLE